MLFRQLLQHPRPILPPLRQPASNSIIASDRCSASSESSVSDACAADGPTGPTPSIAPLAYAPPLHNNQPPNANIIIYPLIFIPPSYPITHPPHKIPQHPSAQSHQQLRQEFFQQPRKIMSAEKLCLAPPTPPPYTSTP
jgi:hypothetical protein